MKLREATIEDLVELLPGRLSRREWQAYLYQMRESQSWAAIDDHGVFAVGGAFLDRDAGEQEMWLHLRARPRVRVRDVCMACASVLELAKDGPPIVATVRASSEKDLRFAEFLGFIVLHFEPRDRLRPALWKLRWAPDHV
ncbi:MAG: hypothetical protein AAFY82_00155 [Pseudomonadota bacterium]